jgi:hypothetical protein
MTHWLLTLSTFLMGWSAGTAWQWYFQRGQCRSCRIRYSVRKMMHPISQRMLTKASVEQRKILNMALPIAEVAISFAPMASAKLGWTVLCNLLRMEIQRRKHGRQKETPVPEHR